MIEPGIYQKLSGLRLPSNWLSLLIALLGVVVILVGKENAEIYPYVMSGVGVIMYISRMLGLDVTAIVKVIKGATGVTPEGVEAADVEGPQVVAATQSWKERLLS